VFFAQNGANGRGFTEFGGKDGQPHQGFLPTGETALFVLAGDDLEKRFSVSPLFSEDHFFARHDILRVEQTAEGEPVLGGRLTLSKEVIDLLSTGRVQRPRFGIDFPARRVETELEWEDLVLDPACMEQVLEVKAWLEHGDALLYDLGLYKKIKPGYRALFYGPPGTGKTLTASLLGKVTQQEVYRIDLSMVISKYIGETEKNLEKVFRKAEDKNWILFFDEADALFGKRTEIHDAHDRYANQEVSYLLQRLEDTPGVTILASNRRSSLDEGFTRRFQAFIHFPLPRRDERLRLWRNSFSPTLPPEPAVDMAGLAAAHEISGGAITNVVRYATLMALNQHRTTVALGDIVNGIRKELQKEGRAS
jgi:hypothetical protein